MGKVSLREREDAVALLYETGIARDTATLHVAGVCGVGYLRSLSRTFACTIALYPCRNVEGEDVWACSAFYRNLRVIGFAYEDVLIIEGRIDSAAVGHFLATFHHERWRGDGDVLQLAEDIAGVRWLIVAAHLPCHSVTVLMVVPQRVVAV